MSSLAQVTGGGNKTEAKCVSTPGLTAQWRPAMGEFLFRDVGMLRSFLPMRSESNPPAYSNEDQQERYRLETHISFAPFKHDH